MRDIIFDDAGHSTTGDLSIFFANSQDPQNIQNVFAQSHDYAPETVSRDCNLAFSVVHVLNYKFIGLVSEGIVSYFSSSNGDLC